MTLVDEIHSLTLHANGEDILSIEVKGESARDEMCQAAVETLWAHDRDDVQAEFDSLFDRLERIPGAPVRVEGEIGDAIATLKRTIG